jgi:hypothetical protein
MQCWGCTYKTVSCPPAVSVRRWVNRRRAFVPIQKVIRIAVIRRARTRAWGCCANQGRRYTDSCLEGPDPTLDLESRIWPPRHVDKQRMRSRAMA